MKNKAEHSILFDSSGCLTRDAMALYIDDKLSAKDLKRIDKHVSACELCASALEGAKHISSSHSYHLHLDQMHGSAWRKSLNKGSKNRKLYYGLSSVAASLILLMGIFFILRIDNVFKELSPIGNSEMAYVAEKDSAVQIGSEIPVHLQKTMEVPVVKKEKHESTENLENKPNPVKPKEETHIYEESYEEDMEIELIFDDEEILEEQEEISISASSMAMKSASEIVVEEDELSEGLALSSEQTSVSKKSSRKRSLLKKEETKNTNKSYYVAEALPIFQGGNIDDFNSYLADSLKAIIPDSVLIESIVISFVVDTAGNVDNVKLLFGTSSETYNQAIVDFVESSPIWIPAYLEGRPIELRQQIEVVLDSSKSNTLQK